MGSTGLKRLGDSGILRCALIGLIAAGITFGFFIFSNNGVFTVADDFDIQQLTFAQAVWNALHDSDPGQWYWNLDLGSSLITGFSFYNLGSPFYWIFLLFPRGSFPYLAGYLYILKYVAASVTSYIYLRTFRDKDIQSRNVDFALIGSLLYAFSGFQTINLELNHFHDVVAFFPLLLWGIENIDNKKKRPFFILAIFFNCLVNYFFFIQEVIFMAVYFLVRFWGEPLKEKGRKMLICLMCGVLGVGMASVLFVPSILYIMGNSRGEMELYLENFVYDSRNLFYLIKGILLPGDAARGNSAVLYQNWNSTSCYLPLFGLSFVFAFIKKDRGWLQKLLIILFAISLSPIAQSGFLLFTQAYQRWWYMFTLMMALATVKVLEKPEDYALSRGIWIYVTFTAAFYFAFRYIPWNAYKEQVVYFEDRFAYFFIIAAAGPILLDLLFRMKKMSYRAVLIATVLCCMVTTGLTLGYYRFDADTKEYIENYEAAVNFKTFDEQYRYYCTYNLYTLPGEAAGIGAFSSTIENSAHDFNMLFDVDTSNNSYRRAEIPGLPQLLGGKYYIEEDENNPYIIDKSTFGDKTLYVAEGSAFPIGFAMDRYILASELISLPKEKRGMAVINAAVIYPSEEETVTSCMRHADVNAIDYEEPLNELISEAEKKAVKSFSRNSHGFKCTTDFKKDSFVYFTVPNDRGWTATIDGNKADIVDSGGMMLLKVPGGKHKIKFSFHTYGLKEGMIIAVLSWLIFIGFTFRTIMLCSKMKEGKNS